MLYMMVLLTFEVKYESCICIIGFFLKVQKFVILNYSSYWQSLMITKPKVLLVQYALSLLHSNCTDAVAHVMLLYATSCIFNR